MSQPSKPSQNERRPSDESTKKKRRKNISKEQSRKLISLYATHKKNWNEFFRDEAVWEIQNKSGFNEGMFCFSQRVDFNFLAAIKNHINYHRRKAKQSVSSVNSGPKENMKILDEICNQESPGEFHFFFMLSLTHHRESFESTSKLRG